MTKNSNFKTMSKEERKEYRDEKVETIMTKWTEGVIGEKMTKRELTTLKTGIVIGIDSVIWSIKNEKA